MCCQYLVCVWAAPKGGAHIQALVYTHVDVVQLLVPVRPSVTKMAGGIVGHASGLFTWPVRAVLGQRATPVKPPGAGWRQLCSVMVSSRLS
jgi:hypothetical protein